MPSGEGNENGEKTTIGLISKKATLHVQHTFFVHFFAVALHDYSVKLPETYLRACLHGVGDPGLVGLVSFVFTLWGTQNKRNQPH